MGFWVTAGAAEEGFIHVSEERQESDFLSGERHGKSRGAGRINRDNRKTV